MPQPLEPLQTLSNTRNLKADAKDGVSTKDDLAANVKKEGACANVKSEFVGNEEEDIQEMVLPDEAMEQLEYSPKDDPTLEGISTESYIRRRVFARTVGKDALV